MAGTLLHISLANLLLESGAVPSAAAGDLRAHIRDYRLGSVLVDLPYYEDLWSHGLRTLLGRSIRFSVWGTSIHVRSPSGLALALLDQGRDRPSRALAMGALTHYAVDLVFHREIQKRVAEIADSRSSPDTVHKRIEDQMDLHVHYDLLGHPGIGTPYARQMLDLRPDPGWVTTTRRAVSEIHGDAPTVRELKRWLASLAAFGWFSSTRFAPWVRVLPDDDPELLETSLALAERAIDLAAEFVRAGLDYLEGALDRDGFLTAVPDRSMLDAGPARAPHTRG